MPRVLATFVAVAALVVGVMVPITSASASTSAVQGVPTRDVKMTLDGFDAGNLISDAVFTDKNTMTEAQIQTFFNSKVSRCLGGTDEDGRPIVCLKDFTITSANRPADTYCNGYTGAPNETAARIIYRVAQSCGINPQVLIVMLQKEQSLVTHSWPSAWRFDIALGQGCPDDAACNPAYVGFFYQIYGAARQMKIYMEGRYFTYYAPGKTWNILYHPVAARNCGSAPVYVANKATSALYYYTPYQPNAAALRAGYGDGDYCSSYGNRNFYNYFTDWFGSTQGAANNPFGNVEFIQTLPGEVRLGGWVADSNTVAPLSVHIYVGGSSAAFTADIDRPDVAAAYPGTGTKHGFDVRVPATGETPVNVCVYAINAGPGANVLLGCTSVAALTGSPTGQLDAAEGVDGGITVRGWAIDPDSINPTSVHIYVDASSSALPADKSRPELVATYPAYGDKHGFEAKVPASYGPHKVCAYAINIGPGVPSLIGCKDVMVPGMPDLGRAPIGSFDSATLKGNIASVSGWAIDPDTAASIAVHLYVGSSSAAYMADKDRPDIAAAYPAYGAKHGFSEALTLPVGTTNVCAYAINTGPGGHLFLGCRSLTVAPPVVDSGRAPFGNFEAAAASTGAVSVSGWAIDPDTADPIKIHVYIDSASAAYTADKARPDVGAAYPQSGAAHGFAEKIPASTGPHQVCVYAINNGSGVHTLLGCRSVAVPAAIVDRGRPPFGNFEAVVASPGGATVSGWAIDPDTADPIQVHIYVDASSAAYVADEQRPDVASAFGLGSAHGFGEFVAMSPGTHQVCVYAINNAAGGHTFLGCRSITTN